MHAHRFFRVSWMPAVLGVFVSAWGVAADGQAPHKQKSTAASPDKSPAPASRIESELSSWLVLEGRHYGHLIGRNDPERVALHVLSLMTAATETDPRNAEAWLWRYDLLSRMGRQNEALTVLQRYVALDQENESAALEHLALTLV